MPRQRRTEPPPEARHYFVDEAGDSVLFNKKKQVVIGTEGCSRFFALGCVEIADERKLSIELETLRGQLVTDPFLRNMPSMHADRGKTAVFFHAKDDPAEVRHQVFNLTLNHDLRFYAVIRSKASLLASVRIMNEKNSSYRYNENEIYDALVKRLFRDRLHKAASHSVTFARRGASDRTIALRKALGEAKERLYAKWQIIHHGPVEVLSTTPKHSAGLQVADYLLWALQRFYERREDRYISALWPKVGLIVDIDDRRKSPTGVYYTSKSPLTLEATGEWLPGA